MKIASFEMNTHVYAYELQISWERSGGPYDPLDMKNTNPSKSAFNMLWPPTVSSHKLTPKENNRHKTQGLALKNLNSAESKEVNWRATPGLLEWWAKGNCAEWNYGGAHPRWLRGRLWEGDLSWVTPGGSGFGLGQAGQGRKKSHRMGGRVVTRRILWQGWGHCWRSETLFGWEGWGYRNLTHALGLVGHC